MKARWGAKKGRSDMTGVQGFKGTGTGLREVDDGMRQYFPEVLFEAQEPGPRNRANCKPIEPTWYYNEQDMPTFRPRGPGDVEDLDSEPGGVQGYGSAKPKNTGRVYHPNDWDDQGNRGAPPRTRKGY